MSTTSPIKRRLLHSSTLGFLTGLVLLLLAFALRDVGAGRTYHVALLHGMAIIGGMALILLSLIRPVLRSADLATEQGESR